MHNVLIVDDSNTMRKIIARSLRQAGLTFSEVFEAGDGLEALQVLEKEKVDFVLSDINMPNMDGVEFLREKRRIETLRDIPVFLVTADLGSDVLVEAIQLGAKGNIKKPFTAEQINAVLEDYL